MELSRVEFDRKLFELLEGLLSLVENYCINVLSRNLTFVLTEIDIHPVGNFHEQRVRHIEVNKIKPQITFDKVVSTLESIYSDLYDINLTVYKALKHETIVEVAYVLKSALEPNQVVGSEVEPMYHARIIPPFYLRDQTEKFDVNWQHQEWKNWWRSVLRNWEKYKS